MKAVKNINKTALNYHKLYGLKVTSNTLTNAESFILSRRLRACIIFAVYEVLRIKKLPELTGGTT